jgi:hypothetical protein
LTEAILHVVGGKKNGKNRRSILSDTTYQIRGIFQKKESRSSSAVLWAFAADEAGSKDSG